MKIAGNSATVRRVSIYLLNIVLLVTMVLGFAGCAPSAAEPSPPGERLRVAITTSLYDTGLWEYLEPLFEEEYGVEMDTISAGTGIALEYGRRGDVDIIAVHSKKREEQFVAEGYGVERVSFACNYFLIVGPEDDPAGIKGMLPEDAFRKLVAAASTPFISRGDNSGTHDKEKTIWRNAGFDYENIRQDGGWYIEAGRGMGPTLLMASEKQAYTLTDIGTFLAYKGRMELVPIVEKGDSLLNVYSVIAVNPGKHPQVNHEMANNLVNFLVSSGAQNLIGNYGVKEYGISLFNPCVGAEAK